MLENATTVKTNQSDEDIKRTPHVVRGILLTQAGLSILLNVTFLVVLVINRNLVKRRRITYHVGNLAVADSLFGLCRFCSNIIEIVKVDSLTLSKVFSIVSNASAFASFSSVLLMALERIVVLKKPFTWMEILPVKKIIKVMAGIWVTVLLLITAFHFALKEMHFVWVITVLLVIFITVGANIYIYKKLQSENRRSSSLLRNQGKVKLLHYKSCALVVSLSIVLVCTCLPHLVATVVLFVCSLFNLDSPSFLRSVRPYLKLLANFNFLLNPVIYIWSVRIYRHAFYRAFNIKH